MLKSTKIKLMQKDRELSLKADEIENERRRLEFEREQAGEAPSPKKEELLKELEELKEENERLKERLANYDGFYIAMFHSMDVLCEERFGDASPVEAIIGGIKDGKVQFVGANVYEDNLTDPYSQSKVYMFKIKFNAR